MKTRGIVWLPLLIIVAVLVVVGVVGYTVVTETDLLNNNKNQRICTDEAKICPDGTAVGRTGPNCEFTDCPAVNNDTNAISANTNVDTNETVNVNSNANSNANTSVIIPTGWKSYTSIKYGFTLNYPPEMRILEVNETNDIILRIGIDGSMNGDNVLIYNKSANEGIPYSTVVSKHGKTFVISHVGTAADQILDTFTITDPTIGWQTYENTTYHYSFKYPEGWARIEEVRPTNFEYFASDETVRRETIGQADIFLIASVQSDRGYTLSQLADQHTNNPTGTVISNRQDATIDGVAALRQTETIRNLPRQGVYQSVIYAVKDSQLFMMQFISNGESTIGDNERIIVSTLSTFQFTD